ncbi:MAG: hypothetical protein ACRDHS_14530 [Actinomycetota bacterium]
MPASKVRRGTKARPRRRDKTAEARARETQASQREAETKKLTLAQYRRRRVIGWTLVALGVVLFAQHLVHHMGVFTLVSPGVDDLIAGYPLAGILAVGGAILLSKT